MHVCIIAWTKLKNNINYVLVWDNLYLVVFFFFLFIEFDQFVDNLIQLITWQLIRPSLILFKQII
jgi:hypothetical protein